MPLAPPAAAVLFVCWVGWDYSWSIRDLHEEKKALFECNWLALTGMTLSRHTLKFFFVFIFSFFSATRVSPINSLCPNLSSSQTDSLRKSKRVWIILICSTFKRVNQGHLKFDTWTEGFKVWLWCEVSTWGSCAACPHLSGHGRWASHSTWGCGCSSKSLCAAC